MEFHELVQTMSAVSGLICLTLSILAIKQQLKHMVL